MNFILFVIFAKLSFCSWNSDHYSIAHIINSYDLQSFDSAPVDYLQPEHFPTLAPKVFEKVHYKSVPLNQNIHAFDIPKPSSFYDVVSRKEKELPKLEAMSLSFLLNDSTQSSANNLPQDPSRFWTEQKSLANIQPDQSIDPFTVMSKRDGTIERLPMTLLAKCFNAVSTVMGKCTITANSPALSILKATLERLEEILVMLDQLDEATLARKVSDVQASKTFIREALERMNTKSLTLCSSNHCSRIVLNSVTGEDCKEMMPSECYKRLAEIVVRHALILYDEIPGVSFDENGELNVDGKCFPAVEAMREYYSQRSGKRKVTVYTVHPPAKIRRTVRGTSDAGLLKKNLRLLIKLHNHVAFYLNVEPANTNQTITTFAPRLVKSIIVLIDTAFNRSDGLIRADIHAKYPVTFELLNTIKSTLTDARMPLRRSAEWILRAFQVPDVESMNRVDIMHALAYWYASVAMAALELIHNVRYADGQVFVDHKPIQTQWED